MLVGARVGAWRMYPTLSTPFVLRGPMRDQHFSDASAVVTRIVRLIEEHRSWLQAAIARTLLVRDSNDQEWRHAGTRIDLGRTANGGRAEWRWEYPTAMAAYVSLSADQVLQLLEELFRVKTLGLPGLPTVPLPQRPIWSYDYLPSSISIVTFPQEAALKVRSIFLCRRRVFKSVR